MAKHLRYDCMYDVTECNKYPYYHPQEMMKRLGITYQYATPQSMLDCWWFWNCENIPENLPPYLSIEDWNPMEKINWGLSEEQAINIRDYVNKNM